LQVWDDIHIVMYYRRFFEWFISYHYQGNRHRPIPERNSIVEKLSIEISTQRQTIERYIVGLYQRYTTVFDTSSVHVYNMHESYVGYNDDIRYSFFCGKNYTNNSCNNTMENDEYNDSCDDDDLVIPNSYHTCQSFLNNIAAKENHSNVTNTLTGTEDVLNSTSDSNTSTPAKINKERKDKHDYVKYANVRHPLIYEEIAYYAKELGLWNENNTSNYNATTNDMKTMGEMIQDHYENVLDRNEYDFPEIAITCPTRDQYQWLLDISIQHELKFVPEYHVRMGEYEIRRIFPLREHDFCHVDAKIVLQEQLDEWTQFFMSLYV
jgi:hypothetical protein